MTPGFHRQCLIAWLLVLGLTLGVRAQPSADETLNLRLPDANPSAYGVPTAYPSVDSWNFSTDWNWEDSTIITAADNFHGWFEAIYPGTDLVVYGDEYGLEYVFILTPGSDPDRIRMRFNEAHSVYFLGDRSIKHETDTSEVIQNPPLAYLRRPDMDRVLEEAPDVVREIDGWYYIGRDDLVTKQAAGFTFAPDANIRNINGAYYISADKVLPGMDGWYYLGDNRMIARENGRYLLRKTEHVHSRDGRYFIGASAVMRETNGTYYAGNPLVKDEAPGLYYVGNTDTMIKKNNQYFLREDKEIVSVAGRVYIPAAKLMGEPPPLYYLGDTTVSYTPLIDKDTGETNPSVEPLTPHYYLGDTNSLERIGQLFFFRKHKDVHDDGEFFFLAASNLVVDVQPMYHMGATNILREVMSQYYMGPNSPTTVLEEWQENDYRVPATPPRRYYNIWPMKADYFMPDAKTVGILLTDHPDDGQEDRNGMRMNLIPGGGQPDGPPYNFYMSPLGVTNEEFLRFLNDSQANTNNVRGTNLFFDVTGNVWYNPEMRRQEHSIFTFEGARFTYDPEEDAGKRYDHVRNADDEPPYKDHPVVNVSWFGAVKYCNWLTMLAQRDTADLCYTEGTNRDDWAPVTATNWTEGIFTAQQRDQWIDYRGFRLPMLN